MALTNENQRQNSSWGDALDHKHPDDFRIYSQNVNGFTLDRRGGQFGEMCAVLSEVQADVFGCQEHNLDVNKPHVKSIMYETIRQYWQRSRMMLGTTPLDSSTMYKPGGTLLLTTANATGRIIKQHTDRWGRWTSQTFQGGTGRQVTIISAYQVVSDIVGAGQITVTAQQYGLLLQTNDNLRSPRAAFRRDLIRYLTECRENGSEIILMGDFNETLGSDPDGLVKIMSEISLTEIMQYRHPQVLPTTYSRGRQCLDYMLVSFNLLPSISKCGYESFGNRQPSDHRAYFADFNIRSLFSATIPSLSKYEPRMLHSTNVRQVTEYVNEKYAILDQSQFFQRIQALSSPGNRHQHAERLDRDLLEASLAAERRITTFNVPDWSVELMAARKHVQHLRKCLTTLKTGIALTPQTLRELTTSCAPEEVPSTRQACQTRLRLAIADVKQIVATSFERRDEERKQMLEKLTSSTNNSDRARAQILRKLQKVETIRQVFSKIKAARGKLSERQGVMRLEIPIHPDCDPKTCTEWQTVELPADVLLNLQVRNQKHFSQAHGTPFTVPPLSTDLGYLGDTMAAASVLDGTYTIRNELDPSVKLLLHHLQHTEEMANLNNSPTISVTAFRAKLAVWRESTTTSPSGLHLGHYKATIARHKYSEVTDDDDHESKDLRDELNRRQQLLLDAHLTMINYSLSRGYSYRRWQTVANTMLFKEPGNIKIHRTRVIHIYEADYNLAMGLKWRSALHQSESLQMLHTGQFGSRPNCNATDPVLLEELQLEMSRVTRKTLIQTNYDAASCYDRIVPNIAMIASRKYGVPPQVTKVNAVTLENAEYRIRTDLGLAPTGYSHSVANPVYGTGQGSGNSPAIWCFLSCTLYECYDTMSTKAVYCAPNGDHKIAVSMIGFVDDSNGQNNKFMENESDTLTDEALLQTQENAQVWSNLLSATGGALELSKCSYHVLKWKFSAQGDPVLYPDRQRYSCINVMDPQSGKEHGLEYLSPYTAHKTLGHYKDPAGTQKEQQRQLQRKSDEMVSFLWKSPLSREETWTFYSSCYVPSLSYPLPNSHFTSDQLTKIQRKAMSIIIARCGLNRHTHRAIIYGPSDYGGLEFKRMYDQQGIGQIMSFMRHWRKQSLAGKLLKTVVAWGNYSACVSKSILEDVATPLPHCELKWIAALRQYLNTIDCWIDVEELGIAALERVHDCYIMEAVINSHSFSATQTRRINYCRLYLNVVTLSDLTTIDGKFLDPLKLRGTKSLMSTGSRWMSIHQETPSELEWRLWRKANLLWSNPAGELHQPLGIWLHNHSQRRIHCHAYLYDSILAIRTQEHRYLLCRQDGDVFRELVSPPRNYDDLPEYAKPAEALPLSQHTWQMTTSSKVTRIRSTTTYSTFHDFISTLDPWEVDLLQHHELYVDPYTACLELTPQFFAGSDGSAKYGTHGAFGWAISNYDGERVAVGMGPTRGAKIDSYRAECSGLLSLLRFLIRMSQYTSMHESLKGVIGTDSQSLLDKIYPPATPGTSIMPTITLPTMVPEWDLLVDIQDGLRQLPGVTMVHVKGHQDDHRDYTRLPLLAQLNVDADKMAGRFQDDHGMHRPFAIRSPNTGAHLHHNTGTITSKYENTIRRLATGPALLTKIREKYHWQDDTMTNINWQAHGKAFQHSNRQRRVHISKLVHDCLPTHSLLNKYDSGSRKCPLCGSLQENRDHIIRCTHPSRVQWRSQWHTEMSQFHQMTNTSPQLRHVLKKALTTWFTNDDPNADLSPELFPEGARRLITQQNKIGWRQLFNGRFSIEWERIQEEYLYSHRRHTKYKRTGRSWQIQLIEHVWRMWMQLWKQRNGEVHGRTISEKTIVERRDTERQLMEIYNNRQHMEPAVQQMLHEDVRDHMQRPLWATRTWLSFNADLIRDSLQRVRVNSTRGVRSIRSYFRPVPRNTDHPP